MYVIKSPRIGQVGAEFVPKPGINVPALLHYGFIVEVADEPANETTDEVSTPAPKKSAKNKKATKES
jgi:hypothetical protein